MRNFFEHQEAARSSTKRLIVLFVLAVVLLIGAIYASAVVAVPVFSGLEDDGKLRFDWWQPGLLATVAAVISSTIALASYAKVRSLGSGGASVALQLGGRLINPGTTDAKERKLVNVVEEMAIASGVPVPVVFVMDHESGINAFAAGYAPSDAAVAVTRGTLDVLTRDELQGVVAHEFSHILNGDMRLNIRLIGVLYGLTIIGSTGLWAARIGVGSGRRRSRSGDGAWPLVVGGLALAALGYIGVFFGRVIKSAVSRQREFLADASAVQFTRNPRGLAGALRKIGGYDHGSRIEAREAEEMSHLFFGDALTRRFLNMFSTHPPLRDRIRRIDPQMAVTFPRVEALSMSEAGNGADSRVSGMAAGSGEASEAPRLAAPIFVGDRVRFDADDVVARVGTMTATDLEHGAALLDEIPELLRSAVRSPLGAIAAVYALLLDNDDGQRQHQLQNLEAVTHERIFVEVQRLAAAARNLPRRLRLPLVELSVPSLRQLSSEQYALFRAEMNGLIEADSRLSLFEFVVSRSLMHWLDNAFSTDHRRPVKYMALQPIREQIAVVLSVLCYAGAGANGTNAALNSFQLATSRTAMLRRCQLSLVPPSGADLHALEEALDTLSAASPGIKRQIIDCCAQCVLADDVATIDEAELMRVVADALGCPLPPWLPSV